MQHSWREIVGHRAANAVGLGRLTTTGGPTRFLTIDNRPAARIDAYNGAELKYCVIAVPGVSKQSCAVRSSKSPKQV